MQIHVLSFNLFFNFCAYMALSRKQRCSVFLISYKLTGSKKSISISVKLSDLVISASECIGTIFFCGLEIQHVFLVCCTEHHTKNEETFITINTTITITINKNRNICIKPLEDIDIYQILLKTHCILNGFYYSCRYVFIIMFFYSI